MPYETNPYYGEDTDNEDYRPQDKYRYIDGEPCNHCDDNPENGACDSCYAYEYIRDYQDGDCTFVPTCDLTDCTACGPVDFNVGIGFGTGITPDSSHAPIRGKVGRPVAVNGTYKSFSDIPVAVPERRMSESEAFNFAAFNTWEVIEQIAGVNIDKLLLWGPPATGKSTLAQTVGLAGRKCYPVTVTEESPAEVLKGHYISVGNEFRWMDGMGTAAMRQNPVTGLSGRLVVNEIGKACGDFLDILYVYCDDPAVAQLTLPKEDLEVICPGYGYQVFGTTNENPQTLPEALQSRFAATIHVSEVNEGAIRRLPEDLQAVARASAMDNYRRVDIRKWMTFASLREQTNAQLAAFACFGRDGASVLAQIEMG